MKTKKNKQKQIFVYDGFSADYIGRYNDNIKKELKWALAPLKKGGYDDNVILAYPKSLNKKDIDEYNKILDKHRIRRKDYV